MPALAGAGADAGKAGESRSWSLTRPLREWVPRASAALRARHRVRFPRRARPIVVCPYVHADEGERIAQAFATRRARDRIPLLLHHDVVLDGPEDAFQRCWQEVAPRDVIIIHSDMAPPPGDRDGRWYRDLCRWARALPDAGAVACNLLFPPGDGRPDNLVQCAGGTLHGTEIDYLGSTRDLVYPADLDHVRQVEWVTFGGVFLRRAALDACGPLDTGYQWGYVRDVDYSLEMRRRGWRLYHCPVTLIHAESQTNAPLLEDPAYRTKVDHNFAYFARKWSPFVGADGVIAFDRESPAGST